MIVLAPEAFAPLCQADFAQALVAEAQGTPLYLVGGALRDWALALQRGETPTLPTDWDVFILDRPAEGLAHAMAERHQGHYVLLDADFGIHRVVFPAWNLTLDLSDALENNLESDLRRRDVTFNAMALNLATGAWHDPLGGLADLATGTVRMVSAENLAEDPLRMLRVFRLAAQVEARHITPETLEAVATLKTRIHQSAPERIHYEFLRLLSVPVSFPWLQAMAETGLLEEILPELRPTRAVPPNGHHHLGLFDHTLELVRQTERLWPEFPESARQWFFNPLGQSYTRLGIVKFACLLHDIGKPETMAQVEGGRLTFYGHDALSETMTEALCKRWKLRGDVADITGKLVRWHLYPCQFGPASPRKSVLRFFRRMGVETPDVLLLALADRWSTLGPEITDAVLEASHQQHLWLAQQYEEAQAVLHLPRLLDGNAVMACLGIPPGPHMKGILEALQEAQQLGEVHTPDEARDWLRRQEGLYTDLRQT